MILFKKLAAPRVQSRLDILFPLLITAVLVLYYMINIFGRCGIIDGTMFFSMGDDAYISMRYAKHFFDGHGLTWNIGQAPIEGYTNFLWVLWISFLMIFMKDPGILMGVSLSLFNIGSVLLLYRFLRKKIGADVYLSGLLALLLAMWRPLRQQVWSGLEGPMLLFLFMIALYLLVDNGDRRKQLTVGAWIAGILPLVRPSGLYFTFILFLCFAIQYLWPERDKPLELLKKWKWTLAGFGIPFILLTGFRVLYYGELLPNTYYLKVTHRPGRVGYGVGYVKRFLQNFTGTVFLLPIFLYTLVKKNRPWLKIFVISIAGNLAYAAYQGGDAWHTWRFMLTIFPLFLILLAAMTKAESDGPKPVKALIAGVIITLLFLSAKADFRDVYHSLRHGTFSVKSQEKFESTASKNIRLALLLKEICHPGAVLAEYWAGAIPYYSELTTIDVLGKSDHHIARVPACRAGGLPGHDKFDFDYVMELKPDVIISRYAAGASETENGLKRMKRVINGFDPAGAALILHPEFKKHYRVVNLKMGKQWRAVYVRVDSDECDLENVENIEKRFL